MTRRRLKAGQKLVVASHNSGKVWEIKELLAPYGLDVAAAGDLQLDEPEETEKTFEGNAQLKAVAAAKSSGLPALADDSGLEVDVLKGAPGIYSARWAGPTKDFSIAMKKLEADIAAKKGWRGKGPKANFTCVLCLAWPDGEAECYAGKVFGRLVRPGRGGNGFGYDPMFVADGETLTFGEMEPDEKHLISHRARAFKVFQKECLGHLAVADALVDGFDDEQLGDGSPADALLAAAANISTKDELVRFIANLREDLAHNDGEWENVTLEAYLEAMEAWIDDSEFGDEPPWRMFAKVLFAAGRYE